MKRFIRHILIFSTIILVPLMAAEIYVRSLPNPSRYKHGWMKEHAQSVETIVLGSSHTFYGISPKDLGANAFSLAQVSQTYRYDCYLLHHYEMPRLRTVILPYSYFSLWEDFESQPEYEHYITRYHIYMDADVHSFSPQHHLECAHSASFKEKLKSLWQSPQMTWDSLGGGTRTYQTRADDWDNGMERAQDNTYSDTSLVRLNIVFLEEIARFCEEHGVQLVLITTPVTTTFATHKDLRQDSINHSVLTDILSRHSSIHYLGFESDERFTAESFFDADHLSPLGAHQLSEILAKEISSY